MATFSQTIAGAQDCGHDISGLFSSTTNVHPIGNLAGVVSCRSVMRLTTVTIPKNATISAATITWTSSAFRSATVVNIKCYCEAADNPSLPSSNADIGSRPLSTAFMQQDNVPTYSFSSYNPSDISAPIQETVNRSGWASSNAMNLHWRDNASSANAFRELYSGNGATPPSISITYALAATANSIWLAL